MLSTHEQLTEQFRKWELRGRGWNVFDEPVCPEPPFVPFPGHFLPAAHVKDDGHRPTFLSSLVQKISSKLSTEPKPPVIQIEEDEEPDPTVLVRDSLVEFQVSLPEELDVSREIFGQFLSSLSMCREPITFELLGTHKKVLTQFAVHRADAPLLHRQLRAFFPEAVFVARESTLEQAWENSTGDEVLAVEFGLAREFMLMLASHKLDPFIGIVGALSDLEPGELGLFQVIWQPVNGHWAKSIVNSVSHGDGKPFFVNRPELTDAAEEKVSLPLFAAVVRILVRTEQFERLLQLSRDLAGSLSVFANPQGNELIPLDNDEYDFEEHIEDVLRRQSRRSGMVLNSEELCGFVHLPSNEVRSPAFARQVRKTKPAPAIVRHPAGLCLGTNEFAGESVPVRLTPEQRVRHTHIIGSSGSGKSTLLFNLICEDIRNGEGVAVLDPHGDLIDRICGAIPPERIKDVVLVDPSDPKYSVGFNILSGHSELEKSLLASDLVAVFQRLSTSWGDQMNSILQTAILAMLDSERKGTIADLRRFLIEPPFRNEFLKSVRDSEVLYYWQKSFPLLSGNKSVGSIVTRLNSFLSQKPIRHMVSQPENRLDFAEIMDSGKIFLAKLPEGLLGRENSYLLGALLVSKFHQITMSRQAQQITARRDFWLYIDEFANFITPSMAEILSGARKYRIGLTLAHQELQQLERNKDVASAVIAHPFTRIVFRVGDNDAKKLAEGFSFFEAKDLCNLETGQAICRVERSDYDFNLDVPLPPKQDADTAAATRKEVVEASRKKYGAAREQVEASLRQTQEVHESPKPKTPKDQPPAAPLKSAVPPSPPAPVSELPKFAEVPMHTGSEKKIPITEQSAKIAEPRREPPVPRDLGRGGNQHRAIQKRIKEAAESLGFRSVIEQAIAGSKEAIDLYLERGKERIACEISISTPIDHEVGNVRKCLEGGFERIAVICIDEERLRKIEMAITQSLGATSAAKVSYSLPDPFIAGLKALPSLQQEDPKSTNTRGYKVKRVLPAFTPEERRQKEEMAARIMVEAMRSRKS